MRHVFFLISIAILSLIFTVLPVSAKSISVRCVPVYPYKYIDENGNLNGMEVELASTLIKHAGFEVQFVDCPWSRALFQLKHGSLTILMNFSKSDEREAYAHYLGVSTYEQTILILRKENKGLIINTLDDFARKGTIFGIRENFFYTTAFHQRYENDPGFKSHFDTVSQASDRIINPKKVASGRITGCFGDLVLSKALIARNKELKDLVVVETPVFPKNPVYFGVSRKLDPQIYQGLQKSYQQLDNEGVFERIRAKWLEKISS